MLLERIQKTNDVKKLDPGELPQLAREIRHFLVQSVSKTGGHLASNLGAVELTIALHRVLDPQKDRIIFDVGHQCYTHKLLTGRREGFTALRQFQGLSGFPKKGESPCDPFDTGHSSTSIAMALGLAQARDLKGEDYRVVAVIGDGAMTGGLAYEALNNAAHLHSNLVIILNDNNMSIAGNVGGLPRLLGDLRTAPAYHSLKETVRQGLETIPELGDHMVRGLRRVKNSVKQLLMPTMFFEDLGLTYLGPVDGHNISMLTDALQDALRVEEPVLLHVVTKKGKGYRFAEQDPERFHGIGKFNIRTGESAPSGGKSYTSYAGCALCELAAQDASVLAITAAMGSGTGLDPFRARYPERFFDVGIAEEYALSFASGLAAGGLKPYVCLYSTFLQRAYDQLIHDICLQKAAVTLLIDRAGLVGADGETHQGMFDVGFLRTAPGLTLCAPKDGPELQAMISFSRDFQGPLAIRYPRGSAPVLEGAAAAIEYGKAELLHRGCGVLLWAVGSMVETALACRELLGQEGLDPTVVNARFIKPFDEELLRELAETHPLIAVLEENNRSGGLGEALSAYCMEQQLPCRVLLTAPEDCFIPQGSVSELKRAWGLDAPGLCRQIRDALEKEKA